MARPLMITDDEVMMRLMREFRRVGYQGASLAGLAEATGLKKASLYHRFPKGKAQMAREVLATADAWLEEHVIQPLASDAPAGDRIDAMTAELDHFYDGGRQACLLNVLSSPIEEPGLFGDMIKNALERWTQALAGTVADAGFSAQVAHERAIQAIALIEGSLVVAQGLREPQPFNQCLSKLKERLLAPSS